jgi:hypothetical protein
MIHEGRAMEWMPRESDVAPMTAYRFHALASEGGDDDMFSTTNVPDPEWSRAFDGVRPVPTLVLISGQDEYIPEHVDKQRLLDLFLRLPWVSAESAIIEGNHALDGRDNDLCGRLSTFLQPLFDQ